MLEKVTEYRSAKKHRRERSQKNKSPYIDFILNCLEIIRTNSNKSVPRERDDFIGLQLSIPKCLRSSLT